mmetsp:Transcript_47839/g.124139  ORF Transcript_47839/g.124139 Transcript_47839/m.124139 type:complete len:424 (-) Transcript_47839:1111-2382(-)
MSGKKRVIAISITIGVVIVAGLLLNGGQNGSTSTFNVGGGEEEGGPKWNGTDESRNVHWYYGPAWRRMLRKPTCDCPNPVPNCLFQRPYQVDEDGMPLNSEGQRGFDGKGSVNLADMKGTIVKAEDITPSDFFCTYYCNCRPVVLRNMMEEWPELSQLSWDALSTVGEVKGHTQAFGKNIFAIPSEVERPITVKEFLAFRTSSSVFPRYSHYFSLHSASALMENIFNRSPGVLNGEATLSLSTTNGSIQIHNDGAMFGGFFGVVKGKKRYVLIHSLETNRMCYLSRGRVTIPPAFLKDMPQPGYSGDVDQIEGRYWPQVCNDGCCFPMYIDENEREKSLKKVKQTARLDVDLEDGDFVFFPPGYLHGVYSYTDTIGLISPYNSAFDIWADAKRGFELRVDFEENKYRNGTIETHYWEQPPRKE